MYMCSIASIRAFRGTASLPRTLTSGVSAMLNEIPPPEVEHEYRTNWDEYFIHLHRALDKHFKNNDLRKSKPYGHKAYTRVVRGKVQEIKAKGSPVRWGKHTDKPWTIEYAKDPQSIKNKGERELYEHLL